MILPIRLRYIRASEGLFPAIDPLQSNSKMASPGIVGERHYQLAQKVRSTLAQYAELEDIIAMLGLEQLSPEDRSVVLSLGVRVGWNVFLLSYFLPPNSLLIIKVNLLVLMSR
jgi:F0F1-type ATP synthase beta subunit